MATSSLFGEGSVGRHKKHQLFAQNLINASRARDLNEAAAEWNFDKIYASRQECNCQLCNTRIKTCVVLKNEVNGNYIVIGEDCYDKFIQFLRIGKVQSALPTRKRVSLRLHLYWVMLLGGLQDRTVLGWLLEELSAGRVTGWMADIIYTISCLGFAPTKSRSMTMFKAIPVHLLISD